MIQEAGGGHDEFWARMSWRKVKFELQGMYEEAEEIEDEFFALANTDPMSAINNFAAFIEKATKVSPDEGALTGGPNPEWTGPIVSAMGIWYSSLYPETKKLALSKTLNFLDQQKIFMSQENVSHIDNPHLVADIIFNRSFYWPGLQLYKDELLSCRTQEGLEEIFENSRSVFFVAFAATRPNFASDSVRDDLEIIHPSLLNATLDAHAAMISEKAERYHKRENTPINETIKYRLSRIDTRYHSTVRDKIAEKKWIKLDRST